jgi:hypothetical protein
VCEETIKVARAARTRCWEGILASIRPPVS